MAIAFEPERQLSQEIQAKERDFNQQLKELNVLIDPQAEHYTEPIEFEGFRNGIRESLTKLRTEKEEVAGELENKTGELNETRQELQNNVDSDQKKITDVEYQ